MARLEKICSKRGVIDIDQENQVAEMYREKLGTKTPTVQQNVGNLSGGNQQKVLLSKWMFADPEILIMDEPTRGIDVGAKYEIYCIMNDLIAQGKSIVMISSELPELLGMCDRIYVMLRETRSGLPGAGSAAPGHQRSQTGADAAECGGPQAVGLQQVAAGPPGEQRGGAGRRCGAGR